MCFTLRSSSLVVALTAIVGLAAGCGRSAAWSPTGQSVVIDVGGKLQLFDVATEKFEPLDTGGRYAVNPTFSPDGKRLAYFGISAEGPSSSTCDLWLRELPGSSGSDRKVAGDVLHLRDPAPAKAIEGFRPLMAIAWSPDGGRVAYARFTNERGAIEVLDLESGAVESLGRKDESQVQPVWSPAGTQLAYLAEVPYARMAEPGMSYDLYVAPVSSGSARERVWDSRKQGEIFAYWTPVWSSDGSRLALLKQEPGSQALELRSVPAEGGASERIARFETPQVAVTPRLDAAAYLGGPGKNEVMFAAAPFDKPQVLDRIDPASHKEAAPFEIPEVPPYPVISRDGKKVALPLVDGHRELRVYEIASGEKRVYRIP